MSCTNCRSAARQALMNRLTLAADAHGYELWLREDDTTMRILAVPASPEHGTPEALVDLLKETGQQGLKLPPSRLRALRARDKSVQPDRRSAGRAKWVIQGNPHIELEFIEALNKEKP